jgi:hypothetical protein
MQCQSERLDMSQLDIFNEALPRRSFVADPRESSQERLLKILLRICEINLELCQRVDVLEERMGSSAMEVQS